MTKNDKSLILVEKQTNLYYSKAKVVNELILSNYTTNDNPSMINGIKTEKEPTFQTMNINEAHHKWGHRGEARLREMAKTK